MQMKKSTMEAHAPSACTQESDCTSVYSSDDGCSSENDAYSSEKDGDSSENAGESPSLAEHTIINTIATVSEGALPSEGLFDGDEDALLAGFVLDSEYDSEYDQDEAVLHANQARDDWHGNFFLSFF